MNVKYFGSRANFLGVGVGLTAGLGAALAVGASPVVGLIAVLGYGGGALLGLRAKRGVGASDVFDKIPEALRRQLTRLEETANDPLLAADPTVKNQVAAILRNSEELFRRILKRGDSQQVRMVSVDYADTLTKLNTALSADYYLDLVRNPALWDRPAERRREVEEALGVVSDQLVKNIQQVNASQDLDLSVALDGLMRTISTPSATDMINGTDAATETPHSTGGQPT